MTLSCSTARRFVVLAIVATLVSACMKDNNLQVAQLVENLDTVEQWSRGPQGKEHVEWLDRSVAWDVVGAITSTWAIHDLGESEQANELLRSGLAEIAAGPGDHVISLVQGWRRSLGTGRCRVDSASEDDLRWLGERLTLPPPKGAGSEPRLALAGYARRASDTRDVVRVDCGGIAHLLVGVLAGKLVPIMRE
jgi:hypothetical protein